MRLLKRSDSGELSLTEDLIDDVPKYAILSHTWEAQEEEVTFEDFTNGVRGGKAGYRKIEFCGNQAARDGLTHFWVDTCCIDKSSIPELQTAINSMFQWYRSATRCYVYLSDLSTHEFDKSVESALRQCRWFGRGWTLQELIAPQSVEFFSSEQKRLGDKISLEQQICKVTGIAVKALQGTPLSEFNIYERRSWMGKRETTRIEDVAYCMLGILDIKMPIIYGEGRKIALERLEESIKKSLDPSSVLLGSKPPWIVPYTRNYHLTGQEPQLAQLKEMTSTREFPREIAITGLGGAGKTQLALEFAYRFRGENENCSVIWLTATNTESLYQAYLRAAEQLGIPSYQYHKTDVMLEVQKYLSNDDAGQWLLVFDNLDDISIWIKDSESEQGSGRLANYLPRSSQGCTIFTTRDKDLAVKLAHQHIVEVPEMHADIAKQLLQKCLKNQELLNNQLDTTVLLEKLALLPLAIVQAAAYINENNIAFAEYLLLLKDQKEDVVNLINKEFEVDGRYHGTKDPVATTWLISFKQIQQRDPLAADYLSFIACIDSKNIPESLLRAGGSYEKETNAIRVLDRYALITKQSTETLFDLHRLVHLATRNWLRMQNLIKKWTERTVERLTEVFPAVVDKHKNRSIWRLHLSHAHYVLKSDDIVKDGENRLELASRFATCLHGDGRYEEAALLYTEIMKARKKVLGPLHQDTLKSIDHLGTALGGMGKYADAKKLHSRALAGRELVLGPNNLETIKSVHNLARIRFSQGNYVDAEALNHRARETREKVLGKSHPETLMSVNNLARVLMRVGRFIEAESFHRRAMNGYKITLGDDHPNTLTSMNNLALVLQQQRKYADAEDLNRQVLKKREETLGRDHPDTLQSTALRASILQGQERYSEAEMIYREMLEKETTLRKKHPVMFGTRQNLAWVLHQQGKYIEAEKHYYQALKGYEKTLGHKHPNTLKCIKNLASMAAMLHQQKNYAAAEPMLRRALEGFTEAVGADHAMTLSTIHNLIIIYETQNRLDEAEKMYIRAFEVKEKVSGKSLSIVLASVNKLGDLYKDKGRLDEAEEMYKQALKHSEKELGPDHKLTFDTFSKLGLLYRDQDNLDKAIEVYERVLKRKEKALGVSHPSTINTAVFLGASYFTQREMGGAAKMLERVVKFHEEHFGASSQHTLEARSHLATIYRHSQRIMSAATQFLIVARGYEKLEPDSAQAASAWNKVLHLAMYHPDGIQEDCSTLEGLEATLQSALDDLDSVADANNIRQIRIMRLQTMCFYGQRKMEPINDTCQKLALACANASLGDDSEMSKTRGLVEFIYRKICNECHAEIVRLSTQGTAPKLAVEKRQKQAVENMIKICIIHVSFSTTLMSIIGRAMLDIKADDEAILAFKCQISGLEDTAPSGADCNGCSAVFNIVHTRYVCRSCEDVDLCTECIQKYEMDGIKDVAGGYDCAGHQFLEVPGQVRVETGFESSNLTQWLDSLAVR